MNNKKYYKELIEFLKYLIWKAEAQGDAKLADLHKEELKKILEEYKKVLTNL